MINDINTSQRLFEDFSSIIKLFDEIIDDAQLSPETGKKASSLRRDMGVFNAKLKEQLLSVDIQKERVNAQSYEIEQKLVQFGTLESMQAQIDKQKQVISQKENEIKAREIEVVALKMEIEKLHELMAKRDTAKNLDPDKLHFNTAKRDLIDYIKVIYVLAKLEFFIDDRGKKSKLKDVFKVFGDAVNMDLSNYSKHMNNSYVHSLNVNELLYIFELMKATQEKLYHEAGY